MKLRKNELFRSPDKLIHSFPSVRKCSLKGRQSQTCVCNTSSLLRTESYFPYLMLVAFEGGSIFRAFILLISYPFLWILSFKMQTRVMIFITFCGLRFKDVNVVSRAVLPKFYLENLNFLVYQVMSSAGSRIVFTCMPRVMVESFLKDHLKVDTVEGTELQTIGKYYTGLVSNLGFLSGHKALIKQFGERIPDIGIARTFVNTDDPLFLSFCKEAYVVSKDDRKASSRTIMSREKYPKPLVFHDGRLAFLPTPLATLTMFMWLPLGILLAIFRFLVVILLPPRLASFLLSVSGVILEFNLSKSLSSRKGKGVLYVCNHRTLLDPVALSLALQKPITSVTYSLSRFSELLSPIRTTRLKRDRNEDAKTITKLLREGDLVVCPEGTTCREPYLLRFSSLFAELTDDIVPVAVNTHPTMFYPTTVNGFKWLDAIFEGLNPRPCYSLKILDKVPIEYTVSGGRSSHEVATCVQEKIAEALGFECTNLTRKDKYLMLMGNEGVIHDARIKT